jgi:DNA-binding NtrC family response regulator
LEKLARRDYQVVISDMKMPGMSGLELFYAIRKSDHLQDTRFLMITGQRTVDLEAIQKAGCAVLTKPFSSETLVEAIENLCSVEPTTN